MTQTSGLHNNIKQPENAIATNHIPCDTILKIKFKKQDCQ